MPTLNFLGFDPNFYANDLNLSKDEGPLARVVEQQKGLFKVADHQHEWWAECSGRLLHEAHGPEDLPVIGDWVQVTQGGPLDRLHIIRILPRKTLMMRRAIDQDNQAQLLAANVDRIFVVSSLNHDLNPKRLDRYRLLVEQSGAQGTLLLTKADLVLDQAQLQDMIARVSHLMPVIPLSCQSGEGMEALRALLPEGSTSVFVGSSGVGKSTLINALMGDDRQDTSEISDSNSRGRHTTSSRSLLTMPTGALLIDTPGIRELGLWNLDQESVEQGFDELARFARQCRFRDCRHHNEPGCRVLEALDRGELDPSRLASYKKLLKEQAYYERQGDTRKQVEEKKKWKAIHKAARRYRNES